MIYKHLSTVKKGSKCKHCNEPIVPGEGVVDFDHGRYCYKCSMQTMKKWELGWRNKQTELQTKYNTLTEEELLQKKMVRRL
jgi:hypothetical protein